MIWSNFRLQLIDGLNNEEQICSGRAYTLMPLSKLAFKVKRQDSEISDPQIVTISFAIRIHQFSRSRISTLAVV